MYLDDSLTEEELRDAAAEQRRNQRTHEVPLREVPFEFTARMNDKLRLVIHGVRFQV